MGRKTQQNNITNEILLKQVNPKNQRLKKDFIDYLDSIQKSIKTIKSYENDLDIFFVWNLQNNDNKFFTEVTKRDIISYQSYLANINKNSPARIRRLKSTLSSMSNYISNILDEEPEFKNFKSIIRKVENPINTPAREKTVFTDKQLEGLLDKLIEKKKYDKACALALCMSSGRRKSELLRFKVNFFEDKNVIFGSLFESPEKIVTKGRGRGGKPLTVYVLKKEFKPYFDLWMEERKRLGIKSQWLFPLKENGEYKDEQMKAQTMDSWAIVFTRMLGIDFYWHSLRHYFTTHLARLGLPDSVIQKIIGWESSDMVQLYKDISTSEELSKYFDENGIKEVKETKLSDL
jgi:site-specific recombinase XerD